MSDNVIILGAGFSYDAGIPLLSGFIERMWECAIRGECNGEPLNDEDAEIFKKAIEVRDELDRYHGRAMFNDRNLEDILSILSFDTLKRSKKGEAKFTAINKAISRTIELCCSVKHPGVTQQAINENVHLIGPDAYRDFWKALFLWYSQENNFPIIITLNYDLVLERSLLQILTNEFYTTNDSKLPFDNFVINYWINSLNHLIYHIDTFPYRTEGFRNKSRNIVERIDIGSATGKTLGIEILKLHGSLNFPKPKQKVDPRTYNIAFPVNDPYILPPIFNKMSSNSYGDMWGCALSHLRAAKNIIIVGYSMPQTDIYMQYFFKSGVGPNVNLNKIFVFDPILYTSENADSANEMKERYTSCFSEQFRNRICFNLDPEITRDISVSTKRGTTEHFVEQMLIEPKSIFF